MALLSASQIPALGVETPNPNVMANYQQGKIDAATNASNEMANQAANLELMATGAAYALPNGPRGEVDPKAWNEVLDTFEASGMPKDKVQAFRDRPEMARVLLMGSANALKVSNDERMFPLELQKLEAEIAKAMQTGGADAETWGVTPQPYEVTDDKGNKVIKIGVLSNRGNFKEVALPEGAAAAFPVTQLNTGTGFTEANKFGGTTGVVTPIDNVGKARDEKIGTIVGDNIANAPKAVATADRTLQSIDSILNDPALPQAVGIGGILPAIPGTNQAGVVAKIDQLKGQAFLEAFASLKGGGQITEVEGKKATDAIARLNRAQNLEDFTAALNELRDVVAAAKTRAQQQAGSKADAPSGATVTEGDDLTTLSDEELLKRLGE
jgi:hypothetical protein